MHTYRADIVWLPGRPPTYNEEHVTLSDQLNDLPQPGRVVSVAPAGSSYPPNTFLIVWEVPS